MLTMIAAIGAILGVCGVELISKGHTGAGFIMVVLGGFTLGVLWPHLDCIHSLISTADNIIMGLF